MEKKLINRPQILDVENVLPRGQPFHHKHHFSTRKLGLELSPRPNRFDNSHGYVDGRAFYLSPSKKNNYPKHNSQRQANDFDLPHYSIHTRTVSTSRPFGYARHYCSERYPWEYPIRSYPVSTHVMSEPLCSSFQSTIKENSEANRPLPRTWQGPTTYNSRTPLLQMPINETIAVLTTDDKPDLKRCKGESHVSTARYALQDIQSPLRPKKLLNLSSEQPVPGNFDEHSCFSQEPLVPIDWCTDTPTTPIRSIRDKKNFHQDTLTTPEPSIRDKKNSHELFVSEDARSKSISPTPTFKSFHSVEEQGSIPSECLSWSEGQSGNMIKNTPTRMCIFSIEEVISPIFQSPISFDKGLETHPSRCMLAKLAQYTEAVVDNAETTRTTLVVESKKRKKKRKNRVRRKCTLEGCSNRVVQGGVCISHGAKRKLCSVDGCMKGVKTAGRCSAHGPPRKRCCIDGCMKVAVQAARCIAHGGKKKSCRVEGCLKVGMMKGMCKRHHDQHFLKPLEKGVSQNDCEVVIDEDEYGESSDEDATSKADCSEVAEI